MDFTSLTNLNKGKSLNFLPSQELCSFVRSTHLPSTHCHPHTSMGNIVKQFSTSHSPSCFFFTPHLAYLPMPPIFMLCHALHLSLPHFLLHFLAAILDDQSVCGRGERLALALARENINSVMEGPARARVEVDIYELQKDSQYDTTDTSEWS